MATKTYRTTRGDVHNQLNQLINTMNQEELEKGFTLEVKPAEKEGEIVIMVNWNS